MDLNGKKVVYVGGFGGIGLATCKQLLTKNIAHLVILDKKATPTLLSELQQLNPATKVHFWQFDVTASVASMKISLKQALGVIRNIDVLINGAGICNDQQVDLTVKINLLGMINTTIAAYELIDKRFNADSAGGIIVNIASVTGLEPFAPLAVYSATKAAVISFTQSLAQLQPITGIAAYVLCPGITCTQIFNNTQTFLQVDPNLVEKVMKAPMQSPEECAVNIIKTIELYKNGAVWLLDVGKIEQIELKHYWQIPEEVL